MGWFLPIKKRKPALRRRVKPRAAMAWAPKTWDPNRTLAGLEALAAVGILLALVLTWHFSQSALTDYLHRRELPRIGANQIQLTQVPPWMRKSIQTELKTLVASSVSSDPLDNASLNQAVRSLAANPWVEKVERIQRLRGGEVLALARYREPVAAVRCRDGLRLVDLKGVCLPGLYPPESGPGLGLPLILGVATNPPADGQVWMGQEPAPGAIDDLHAGLALVSLLRSQPYYRQAQAFDVGQRDQRSRISLVIKTRNSNIIWGLPPGEEKAVESEPRVKLLRLAQVWSRYRSIDMGKDLYLYQVDDHAIGPRIQQPVTEDHSLAIGYTWSE